MIANAAGAFGSSLDYLERTRVALVSHGIVDPYLERIATKVATLRERSSAVAVLSTSAPGAHFQQSCAAARVRFLTIQIATWRPPSTSSVSPVT